MKIRRVIITLMAMVIGINTAISCSELTKEKSEIHALSYEAGMDEQAFKEMLDEVVVLVNEARIAAGLLPLYTNYTLTEAATLRASETVTLFAHQRPNDTYFNTALNEFNVPYASAAENIAAGCDSPEATFNQWKNSASHWKSIMNPKYTHIGVGMTYAPDSTYKWYWTQLFIGCSKDSMPDQYLPERYPIKPVGYGDLDGDGEVSCFDMIIMRKLISNQARLNDLQMESADCMKDGSITTADAKTFRNYLLGKLTDLPFEI